MFLCMYISFSRIIEICVQGYVLGCCRFIYYYVVGSGWLFSRRPFCKIVELRCWMAIVLMFIRVSLILDFLKLYVVLRIWIEGLCMVPLAPAKMTRRGATFQPSI
jgi:hypothetical protein